MAERMRDISAFPLDQTVRAVDRSVSRSWDGAVDAPYVTMIEQFEGFSHAEIYAKVRAMEPQTISVIADRWRESGSSIGALFHDFTSALRSAMEGWEGRSRDAAAGASNAFSSSGDDFGYAARLVAPRLEEISHVAAALRSSVQPPAAEPAPGGSLGDPGAAIAAVEAANEARSRAIEAMNAVYKPTFQPGGVGDGVPAFVSPVDPAPGFGDQVGASSTGRPSTNSGAGTTSSSDADLASNVSNPNPETTPLAQPASTQMEPSLPENLGTRIPETAELVLAQEDPLQSSAPDDVVRPAATTPLPSVQPVSTAHPDVPRLTSDYRPGTPNVSTPAVAPNPGLPLVGPSTPQSPTNPVVAQSSPRPLGTRGFGGHGMMPGAAGARRQDDETERKTPDYLITEENANELVGNLPRTAPPVLGEWDERS